MSTLSQAAARKMFLPTIASRLENARRAVNRGIRRGCSRGWHRGGVRIWRLEAQLEQASVVFGGRIGCDQLKPDVAGPKRYGVAGGIQQARKAGGAALPLCIVQLPIAEQPG